VVVVVVVAVVEAVCASLWRAACSSISVVAICFRKVEGYMDEPRLMNRG
jgi:hypothetical protein